MPAVFVVRQRELGRCSHLRSARPVRGLGLCRGIVGGIGVPRVERGGCLRGSKAGREQLGSRGGYYRQGK